MISAQEIADWRAMAPWNTDDMVEQDYLICRAVAAIFEDKFLAGQVAMRGGTVLHKGHLSPAGRYSEDIDLIIRNTHSYSPSSEEAAIGHLKVEVNVNEQKSFYPLVKISIDVPDNNGRVRQTVVESYDVDEMLGTKMRALLQREHGRDLFDLWWAVERAKTHPTLRVNPVRVGAAFRFYMAQEGSPFSAADFERELARRMRSRKFLKDMDGYLPKGGTYDPNLAH